MRWIFRHPDIVSSDLLGSILKLRGLDESNLPLLPDPAALIDYQKLYDTQSAAEQITEAVKAGKKIFVYGDYDVDGVCATAILWQFMHRDVKADCLPYIPSRFDTGYGLTAQSLDHLVEQGAELIITVDCGIRDVELIKEYQKKGIDFIVTDHHQFSVNEKGETQLPDVTIVHPRHPKQQYPQAEICATTVAWKLAQAIANKLEISYDQMRDIDLVALATSCDMMPLLSENRLVVSLGLQKIRQKPNLGIVKLYQVAGIKLENAQAYHLGFVLGPRLNAAGRLESAMTALRLLCTQNPTQALELAMELDQLNKQRQDLTQNYLDIAEQQIIANLDNRILFAYGDEWPEGILGLVAGKLAEKFSRPVLVGSHSEGKIVGSARSIEKLHITNVLNDLQKYLLRYGGHAQAAGFTVDAKQVEQFKEDLQAMAFELLQPEDLEPLLYLDFQADSNILTLDEVSNLQHLEPHGIGNPKPNIGIMNVTLDKQRIFGKAGEHVSWSIVEQPLLEAVWFGQAGRLPDLDLSGKVDLAVQLGISEWQNNKKVQGIVKDIRRATIN